MISIGNRLERDRPRRPHDHLLVRRRQRGNGRDLGQPSGGTPLDVFDYTYNADGELTAVSDDNSSYQYTYNADGEETSQADVGSPDLPTVTLTYDYDADGNRTAWTTVWAAWSATLTTPGTS